MIKTRSVFMIIMSGLLCAYGMLGFNRDAFAQPLSGKCGDGICDDFEKAHPDACPGDCLSGEEDISAVSEDSPFGFHPAVPFEIAKEMGVKWTRGAECPYLFWKIVDPQKKGSSAYFKWQGIIPRPDGVETFIDFDKLFLAKKAGLEILQNIDVQSLESPASHFKPGSWLPTDQKSYRAFVIEAVKRYSFIRCWQVSNEPNFKGAPADFAQLQQITYEAIKEGNPRARVLIAGLAGNMDTLSINDAYYEPVLKELKGKYLDVFDIHFYGDAKGGTLVKKDADGRQPRFLGYRDFKTVYEYYRGLLDKNGFAHVPIWITEMGTFSGTVVAGPHSIAQTEAEQARDLLKRYVYPLSLGVKKIFWAFGIIESFGEWDNDFFDHTGLVYSDRDGLHKTGQKKLGYYTYKLMTQKLEGSDWSNIQTVKEDQDSHIYIYKFIKAGKEILVAWWDYFNDPEYPAAKDKKLVLPGLVWKKALVTEALPRSSSGVDVKEGPDIFNQNIVKVDEGVLSLNLNENPVYIEE